MRRSTSACADALHSLFYWPAVLVAWLLAERIVAPGQLAWSVLRGTLPLLARRPLHVLFWALFAAIVLWPFY